MAPKRSSNRKRQAKLAFSPLPSSSAAADLPPPVKDKAAAVKFVAPERPSKKRKTTRTGNESDGEGGKQAAVNNAQRLGSEPKLLTPRKSVDYEAMDLDNSGDWKVGIIMSPRGGMFSASEQEPAFSSTGSSTSTEDEDRKPYISIKNQKKGKKKGKKGEKAAKVDKKRKRSADSSSEEAPRETRRTLKRKKKVDSESEEEEIVKVEEDSDEVEEVVPVSRAIRATTRQTRQKNIPQTVVESDNNQSDDIPIPHASPTTKSRMLRTLRGRKRSPSSEVPDSIVKVDSESAEDEDDSREDDGVQPDDDPSADDSEDDMPKRRTKQPSPPAQDSSDDEVQEVKTPRRRLIRKKVPVVDDSEQEELREDLEWLKSSPQDDSARKPLKLNPRLKALEELKRRRQGVNELPSSATQATEQLDMVDLSDSDEEEEIEDDDEATGSDEDQDQDEDEGDTELGYPEPSAQEIFQKNDDDDDFIIDEADEPMGAPDDMAQIPIEFSRFSRAKPRELFKYVVEWMVQKKINPAFSAEDPVYRFALDKLNGEVQGLASSKFSSSIWTADFTRALNARPEMELDELSAAERAFGSAHCEACNRKKHPATWRARFAGAPYNRETLEPLENDSSDSDLESSADDSDSDSTDATAKKKKKAAAKSKAKARAESESTSTSASASSSTTSSKQKRKPPKEKKEYNSASMLLPPLSRAFTLGAHCKTNAHMAHTLHHWRYHLNDWVVDYVVKAGHCTPEKLVKRDGWSTRKRQKYANKIVDEMEECGEIKRLHRMYRERIDYAVEQKTEFRRWGG